MKKVYIVVGPESSGTRVVTRLLCMAGCAGDHEHEQRLDQFIYEDNNIAIESIIGQCDLVVFRRSIPHYPLKRPDILAIGEKFKKAGYEPYYILTMRSFVCNVLSKVAVLHSKDEDESREMLIDEWKYILGMINEFGNKFYIIATSYLFINPKRTIRDLGNWFYLSFPPDIEKIIYDADAKYYEEKEIE